MCGDPDFYWNYVRECKEAVLRHFSLGRITSTEILVSHVETLCSILDPIKAFTAFQEIAPYRWDEIVDEENAKIHQFDLGKIAIDAYQTVIVRDVLSEVMNTETFRFMSECALRMSRIMGDKSKVVFVENYKNDTKCFELKYAIQLSMVDGRTLSKFLVPPDEDPVYTLEHDEEALIWLSEQVIPKPKNDLEYYLSWFPNLMIELGLPPIELSNAKTDSVENFKQMIFKDFINIEEVYDLYDYHYLAYYSADSVVYWTAGFNTDAEFESVSEKLVEYVQKINDQSIEKSA